MYEPPDTAAMVSNSADNRIIRSKFRPPWWLGNRQAQTVYPQFPWAYRKRLKLRRETLELPDGDATAVDWPRADDAHMTNWNIDVLQDKTELPVGHIGVAQATVTRPSG